MNLHINGPRIKSVLKIKSSDMNSIPLIIQVSLRFSTLVLCALNSCQAHELFICELCICSTANY